jgi:putative cardiolipin synthase
MAAFVSMQPGCARLDPIFLPSESTPAPVARGSLAVVDRVFPGNWQVPLNDGSTALDWRLRAIDSATSSIELQSFIWKDDVVGKRIADRLFAAAARGVQVRVLIDDSFLVGQDRWVLAIDQHENIEYRVYNPYKRRSSSALSRVLLNENEFHRLDHRMHNKVMVVDGQVGIVGGRNLADEYFGLDPGANFRDMELIVGGPVVDELTDAFDRYWNDHWSFPIGDISHVVIAPPRASVGDGISAPPAETSSEQAEAWRALVAGAHRGRVRLLVDDPPQRNPDDRAEQPVQVAGALYDILDGANREIVIVSAYLIPTPTLTATLRAATERGVRITMLTNSINSNNHISAYAAYRRHVAELVSLGAMVHELRVDAEIRPRYIFPPVGRKNLGLHAKYLVIDGRQVFIGSSNLDPRSLRINTEIGLLVTDAGLAQRVLELTAPDFERTNSWELSLDETGRLIWIGHDTVRDREPARSGFQRLEEWLFAHLPIEDEL